MRICERSHILPKLSYRIFFHVQLHFQNRTCENYAAYPKIRTYATYFRICHLIFLVQRCFETVKYFWRLTITQYLQLDVERIKYSTDSGERESRPFREEPDTLLYFN